MVQLLEKPPLPVLLPRLQAPPPAPAAPHKTCYLRVLLQASLFSVLALAALGLVVSGGLPILFVGLVAFLPALLPFLLFGLAVLATLDLEPSGAKAHGKDLRPCSCHEDRMAAAT